MKAKELAEEEKKLAWNLDKLENLAKQQQAIEEKCKRELYGRALLRQHQTALRRRSAVVQAELEADLDWLSEIAKNTQMEEQMRISNRQRERDILAETRKRIEMELEKERKQEIELDAIQSWVFSCMQLSVVFWLLDFRQLQNVVVDRSNHKVSIHKVNCLKSSCTCYLVLEWIDELSWDQNFGSWDMISACHWVSQGRRPNLTEMDSRGAYYMEDVKITSHPMHEEW